MKKILLIFLSCFACCLQICFATGNDDNPPANNGSNMTKIRGGQTSGRPHMPDRQIITCAYDDENICLDFAYSEGMCDVYVTDALTGETQYFKIDSSELSVAVYVGSIGESYITLVTENGNTYEGAILGDDPD